MEPSLRRSGSSPPAPCTLGPASWCASILQRWNSSTFGQAVLGHDHPVAAIMRRLQGMTAHHHSQLSPRWGCDGLKAPASDVRGTKGVHPILIRGHAQLVVCGCNLAAFGVRQALQELECP